MIIDFMKNDKGKFGIEQRIELKIQVQKCRKIVTCVLDHKHIGSKN
jgi:hypothetical protein